MNEPQPVFPQDPKWPGEGSSRVPFWAYTREDLYKRELERLFYARLWCKPAAQLE